MTAHGLFWGAVPKMEPILILLLLVLIPLAIASEQETNVRVRRERRVTCGPWNCWRVAPATPKCRPGATAEKCRETGGAAAENAGRPAVNARRPTGAQKWSREVPGRAL